VGMAGMGWGRGDW